MKPATTTADEAPLAAMLTEPEAAALMKLSAETLKDWRYHRRAGRPVHCRIGGAVRYRRSDIEAFIETSIVQEVE
ncbi:helix-turn-helix domain-containing protein [Variovorax sp. SRS16]|uniref:helix-turn-helix domain-containing protein n=1 Tax=Variovorax sp. SRS16 TaxID=282217 RepID=UPI0013A5BB46|nr:helix-turn-helix domain-containing protein [Variovorax sp. SRS16]